MNLIFTRVAVATALLAAAGTGTRPAIAQEPPPPPPSEIDPQEEVVRDLAARALSMQETNEPGAPTETAQSNPAVPPAGTIAPAGQRRDDEPRYQRDSNRGDDRRSSRRSNRDYSSQSRSAQGAPGQTAQAGGPVVMATNSFGRPDFSNFRLIADRNIFDPNRRPLRVSGPSEKPKSVESFSLVGIMSYEKGTFAFFDGTSSTYRKALKQDDRIAGYRLAAIDSAAVKLATGTNEIELQVGTQLRREDDGGWTPSRPRETSSSSASTTSNASSTPTSTDSAPAAGESDVLKRLRERRDRE